MKKKKWKITKTELFKKQEKELSKEVKKDLNKVMKQIAKNPEKVPHSMSLFGKPSPEELKQWMGRTKAETIDLVLEYLYDKDCLNKKGSGLTHSFWEKYIKKEAKNENSNNRK